MKIFRRQSLLAGGLLLCSALLLSGCVGKKVVRYVPLEERNQMVQTESADYEIPDLLDEPLDLLQRHYLDWQGTPYQLGGDSRKGIDCSGFVRMTYEQLFGRELPRTVAEQACRGKAVDRKKAKAGDLVFFKTGRHQNHVGIYLEKGLFLHVSRAKGVKLSRLNSNYWSSHYWQIRRI